jgi:hypothetical protein
VAVDADVVALLRAKFEAVLPHLDERQQRLVMAADARSLGHGGIAAVASATGASRSRISQGVAELEAGEALLGRVRRAGGGRKSLTATDPALLAALLALVEPTRRGDPESPLCWTTLSTRKLAAELTAAGHKVGPDTVARLLRESGFSLQANAKTLEGGQHPDRDGQFSYLNDQASEHLADGQPVISVDTKKKELVGPYKNGGAEWRPAGQPEKVKVHDFLDPTLGKANPYGVYDLGADTGWVAWAPTTTPPPSPSRPSAAGGSPPAPSPTPVRPGCSSPPTAADPTATAPDSGRPNSPPSPSKPA